MTANAGTIEAQLILNASQFQKGMQAAAATAQSTSKNIGGATQMAAKAMNQAVNSVQRLGKESVTAGNYINSMNSIMQNQAKTLSTLGQSFNKVSQEVKTAQSSFTSMGNSLGTLPGKTSGISGALSSMSGVATSAFSKVGSGVMTVGNALGSLTNSFVNFNVWMGALVGYAFAKFTVGAAMATQESLSLFKFVGMGADEVNRLNQATNNYAAAAAKVSQPELLSAWKLVRISQKMTGDQMIANQGVLGDTIALFKANGRTAEDAGRAIEDAMAGGADGIKRLKEIGITSMQELYDRGFDPSKPETFFQALKKVYDERGVTGYANKVTSLADRFENLKEKIQLAGIAAGEVLMPAVEALVNTATGAFEGMGATITGLVIAFSGLTIVLGLFWPTLVTIGSGLATVAGKMFAAAGATAIYGAAAKGAEGGNIGLLQSLKSIPPATAAAALGFGVAVAGLIALTYALHVANSASAAWARAEEAKNNQVKALEGNNKLLNAQIDTLIQKRSEEAAAGKNTYLTDQLISAKRKEVTANTNAAADAEKRYKDALSIKAELESRGQTAGDTAMTEGRAASQGMTVQEYLKNHPEGAETNIALEKTAMLQANINTAKFKYAGTMERINKQEDNYSKYWKGNQEGLQRYSKTYEAFAKSSENYFKAQEEGKLERMIFFGVESGFLQAQLAVSEFWASVAATGADLEDLFKNNIGKSAANMLKPAENAARWLQDSWNGLGPWFGGLTARLGQLWGETVAYFQGAWNNTVASFQGGAAWIQGAWTNTVAFLQGAWSGAIGTVLGIWNGFAGAVSAGVYGIVSIGENGLSWAYSTVRNLWDMVSRGVKGVVSIVTSITGGPGYMTAGKGSLISAMSTAAGPIDMLKGAMSGIGYQFYYGHQKSPAQVMADGCGNCVDLTLTAMGIAKGLGMSSRAELGRWAGGNHMWGVFNGSRLDFARKNIEHTYIPPAAGPGRDSGIHHYHFEGANIFGYDEFTKRIERANNKIVRRY